MTWRATGALVAGLLAGCGPDPVDRDPAAHTQTSELEYRLERHDFGYSAKVPYTFTNRSGVPVLFDHCEGDVRPLLQVRRDGRWVDAWHPLMRTCESAPREVPAGGVMTDTLSVVGSPPGSNVSPSFVFEDVEGVYRLYWFQARLGAHGGGEAPDDAWRVSNAFVLAFR